MSTEFIWLLIKPSQLMLYAAILGFALSQRPFGRACRALSAAALVLGGLLPTAALLMRPLEQRFATPQVDAVTGIVVLAGSEIAFLSALHEQPQLNAAGDRLTTFLMLAHRYPEAQLVHSGAGIVDGTSQSSAARALILGSGISKERVRFEDRSQNTCENAAMTRALVEPQPGERWLLVTSALHMPRAVACFRAVDWNITPYPTDFKRGPSLFAFDVITNLDDLDLAAHEWLGLLYYRLRGATRELFPRPAETPS